MPSTILPVPPQVGHAREPSRPEPRHSGQIFSPLPGVPGRASSPGLSLALLLSDELCSRAMAVSPRSFRTPTPNRRAEFALLRQKQRPRAPPEAVQTWSYRTSRPGPARVNGDGRERVSQGLFGPSARTAVLRERTARSRGALQDTAAVACPEAPHINPPGPKC